MSEQKLSHRQYRALLKKQKRKEIRQAAAQQRDAILKNQGVLSDGVEESTSGETLENNMEDDVDEMTEEQRKAHEEWLKREEIAQEEFRKRKAKEEAEKQKKLQEQRRIKEEWNAQQQKEQEEKDKKDKELEDVLQQLDKENKTEKEQDSWPWHNPEPSRKSASTETNRENCSFFLKTGACRFGERCSRAHQHPAISSTLMFPGMYSSYAIEQSFRDEYDADIGLEYDEGDAYKNFLDFYEDVLPEFKALGKVVQFKVCCNWEPHLRGNVYVQFATEEECSKAYTSFNGRWYAGKQIVCQYTPVSKWKGAICGTFHYNKCPRGKNCNFLHVFINPKKEFADADRDFDKDQRGQRSDNHWSRRSQYSNRGRSRDRGRSRSRDRRYRSRRRSRSRDDRRRSYSRSRSRSRERRDRSHDRDKRYYRSRSRSRERRSRSRSRSASRERRSRRRNRHESRSRSRSRSRSKERNKRKKKQKHRNHSKERKQKRSRRKESESSDSDTSSNSESDSSDSKESEKVTNGSADSKPASEETGVYPNLAHLIARDYGLLPPTSDASSEPQTPSVGQRSSEPPTPSAAQRISSDLTLEDQGSVVEVAQDKLDDENSIKSRSKESHSQKKHKHKHKHKPRHKHKKQSMAASTEDELAAD